MPSAIVIGAGPAGSVAALLLARAKWQVALIEQHRFPRDKVCGECLSACGADVLRRAGLFDRFISCRPVQLVRTLLHAPGGVCAEARLPRAMWGLSRVALDSLLLDAAGDAGVRLLQPARCEAVQPGRRPRVRLRHLVSNTLDTTEADVVLVADGKSALFHDGPPPATGDLGIKAHFVVVDAPLDAVELFGLRGCYGGLAPVEGGRWNLAVSVPERRVRRHRGRLGDLLSELLLENVSLRKRLARAVQVGHWLAAPVPRFPLRRDWPQGVVPIGNAASAIEPIGGEGMGLAMRSAELVAGALASGPDGGKLRPRLTAIWRRRGLICRAGALAASSPGCARVLAPLLRRAPLGLRPVLALMGK